MILIFRGEGIHNSIVAGVKNFKMVYNLSRKNLLRGVMYMKKIETIISDLNEKNGELFNIYDWSEEIITAFGDYSYEDKTEVIVTCDEHEKKLQAYINHEDAPIIVVELQLSEYNDYEEFYQIKNVYIA